MLKVLILPGDGIGPEIMASAKTLLTALAVPIQMSEALAGGAALAEGLDLIPPETLARITDADATLKGPITTPIGRGFSSVNVSLRQHFELYANVRPILSLPGTKARSGQGLGIVLWFRVVTRSVGHWHRAQNVVARTR